MTETMDSILLTIKKLIGGVIDPDDDTFNVDLIIHINTVLTELLHMGIGTPGFTVTSSEETWENFLGNYNSDLYSGVKSYVYFKVKNMFDPPTSSALKEAYAKELDEITWRLHSFANFSNQII